MRGGWEHGRTEQHPSSLVSALAHSSGLQKGPACKPWFTARRGHRRPEPACAQWAVCSPRPGTVALGVHRSAGPAALPAACTCSRHGLGAALLSILRLMLNSECQRPSVCKGGLQVSQTETYLLQRKKLRLSSCQQLLPVPMEKAGTCSTNWWSPDHPGESGWHLKDCTASLAFGNTLKQK